jgi:hypothetical protein
MYQLLHLCYDLITAIHSHQVDPTKTLPKLRFWTEQLKRAHMIRYGDLGNNIDTVRRVMKHTRTVLRTQNGITRAQFNFI